jgi:hypothetical protein
MELTHHDPVWMPTLVFLELLPFAETCRADIHSVLGLADGIRTSHAYRMCEVALTAVAFYLYTRLSDRFNKTSLSGRNAAITTAHAPWISSGIRLRWVTVIVRPDALRYGDRARRVLIQCFTEECRTGGS